MKNLLAFLSVLIFPLSYASITSNPSISGIESLTKHVRNESAHKFSVEKAVVTSTKDTSTTEQYNISGGDIQQQNLLDGLRHRAKITSYFALWYALNVVYNIVNKKLLNVLPAPLTVGTLQLFVGSLYTVVLWMIRIRPMPIITPLGQSIFGRVGLCHGSGQLLSMMSLGAGPVSFTHIVKALEPLFSAVVSALIFHTWMSWQVYASLIPVVGGVAYAVMKEYSFSWLSLNSAMGSNVAFAFRAVLSKAAMMKGEKIGSNLSSANVFGLVTIIAFIMSAPAVLIFGEVSKFATAWKDSSSKSGDLISAIFISGLFHYLNNEVMYLALSNVHPVTLAVGNTMKRVFIMVASILVFQNPVSVQAGIGSVVGISGVLLYSLVKYHFEHSR